MTNAAIEISIGWRFKSCLQHFTKETKLSTKNVMPYFINEFNFISGGEK